MAKAHAGFPIEVWEESHGQWAFRVGHVVQLWDPEEPGNVAMDEERAGEAAEAVRKRLLGQET